MRPTVIGSDCPQRDHAADTMDLRLCIGFTNEPQATNHRKLSGTG